MKALCFGAVLWDVAEDKEHLGGALLNLGANLKQLGDDAYLYSCIGTDEYGYRALEKIQEIGMNIRFVERKEGKPTGYAKIVLDENKAAVYEFPKDASHEYIYVSDELLEAVNQEKFDLVCYGTFCQRGDISRRSLYKLLKEGDFKVRFCDINLRQDIIDIPMVENSFSYADILKLNDEEVVRISTALYGKEIRETAFVTMVQKDFDIDVVCVTKGSKGCTVYDKDGNAYDAKAPEIDAVSTVGAGDAFSSAFLSSYFKGYSLKECGIAGNILGAFVASQEGAIVPFSDEIKEKLLYRKG